MSLSEGHRPLLALSFQHRILLVVTGLLIFGVGGLVLAMVEWVGVHTEGDVRYRLGLAQGMLKRLYREETALRARRFESLAAEPRYVALGQVMEMEDREATLTEQVEEQDLTQSGWMAVGFASIGGRLLAWRGPARAEVAELLRGPGLGRSPAGHLVADNRQVMEVMVAALHPAGEPERTTGYLLVGIPWKSSVLDEYARAIGGSLELNVGGQKVAGAGDSGASGRDLRFIDVPLARNVSFRFSLDVAQVGLPLRSMLRTMSVIALGVILLGSAASFVLARRVSRPIGRLARAAKEVGKGSQFQPVAEEGAPELRVLAKNFNEMVRSLAHSQEELKAHANEVLEVEERERQKIAQDLHDGLGQDLAGIALHCQALEKRLSASQAPAGAEARRIAELVNRTIDKARALGRGLWPAGLEKNDLEAALREMASFVRQTFGVSCVVDWDPALVLGDRAVATNLYWIAQEATTNALRHGKPRTIWLRAALEDGEGARLTIRDDGAGLGPEGGASGGMGLRTMRSRAEMIGGSFQVGRHPEGGTVVTCEISRGVRRVSP
jgi:signal transduction histidine kinase